MVKIGFFELKKKEKKYIKEHFKEDDVVFVEGHLDEGNVHLVSDREVLGVFVYSKITGELLDKMPNLKFIATFSTGFDHIDLEECRKRGIKVSNVPFYGENTVAEHAMALLLCISRRIIESYDRVRQGNFEVDGICGFDLKGKTIGIIGGGHIGMHVVRMAKGFEMNVLVYDLHENKELEEKMGFRYVDINYLLENSDIISLHVPYNKYTHHLINKGNIYKMKKGVVLINTSRGGVIETDALVEALEKKHVAWAGLDVLEGECEIKEERQLLSKHFENTCDFKLIAENHILINLPNVIVTPHNAFNSKEALTRILDTSIKNIKMFLDGKWVNKVY